MRWALTAALVASALAVQARAAEFVETFSGTIVDGTAAAGVLGPSLVDLAGLPFELLFAYDTTDAVYESLPPDATIDFSTTPASHLLALQLIVDGRTVLPDYGYVGADLAEFDPEGIVFAGLYDSGTMVHIGVQGAPALRSFDQPFAMAGVPADQPDVLSFAHNGGSTYIQADLAPDYASLATTTEVFPSTVPEPSAWALLLIGLAAIGGARRLAAGYRSREINSEPSRNAAFQPL